MSKPRKLLLDRLITLSGAEDAEDDMRAELQYATKRADFYTKIESQVNEIKRLIAFHCGLADPNLVKVPDMFEPDNKLVWIHGSFNMCIPVRVENPRMPHQPVKMALKIPLPYKIGEDKFPGNAEEKLRSEVATYVWINDHCPDIPIPRLRGFGVPHGLSVSVSCFFLLFF